MLITELYTTYNQVTISKTVHHYLYVIPQCLDGEWRFLVIAGYGIVLLVHTRDIRGVAGFGTMGRIDVV